jgi:hypothetical protein
MTVPALPLKRLALSQRDNPSAVPAGQALVAPPRAVRRPEIKEGA